MKRFLPLGLVLLAFLAACGGGGGGATNALQGKTASQVVSAALAAAKASGSVHFDVKAKASTQTETIVGDASATDGRETISGDGLTIEAEVIGKEAFVKGNAGALEDEMGLTGPVARSNAGKWISISSTDKPYASITTAVRLKGTLSELDPTAPLALTGTATRAGQSVVGVRGGLPGTASGTTGTATLYVAKTSPNVPIVFDVEESSSGTKQSEIGTYTDWGQPLQLVAPTSTVAFSKLAPTTTTPTS
jgi:hypothetical protein